MPKADIKNFMLELREDQNEPLASFARAVATGMGESFLFPSLLQLFPFYYLQTLTDPPHFLPPSLSGQMETKMFEIEMPESATIESLH